MVINQKAILRILLVAILVTFLLTLIGVKPVSAGAPWSPEPVSPANNSQGDGNPPQLCAKNMGDPEGDPVQIRFEVWGGSEADHISPWMDAGSTGNVVCWRDSAPWTTETHAWAARAVDNHGEQSGASPAWAVQIPSSPTPVPTCTVDDLTVSPPAPQPVGTVLSIYASASCSNGVSSLRFSADGNVIGTVSGASGTVNWNTTGAAATAHTITVEAADGTGTIRKSRSTNYDLTSGAPPPTQQVACSIDSFNVSPPSPQPQGTSVSISGSASCNTGVRAIRLKIDGGIQYEIGSTSINYSWNTSGWSTGNHTIVIEAAGIGDNSWAQAPSSSKTYRLEGTATNTPAPNPQTYFQTGDIIQIGYDIFVIVDGQRRLVPNPETLDALGIPRSWIDNKGFSDTELSQIPKGPDIPDVSRDPSGFQDFKNRIFPNTSPIIPQPGQPPSNSNGLSLAASPTTTTPSGHVTASWSGLATTGNDWISLHPAGSPDSNYISWQYAKGASGSVSFNAPSDIGQYEFRLFRNGQKVATSNVFTVTRYPTGIPTQSGSQPPASTNDNDSSTENQKWNVTYYGLVSDCISERFLFFFTRKVCHSDHAYLLTRPSDMSKSDIDLIVESNALSTSALEEMNKRGVFDRGAWDATFVTKGYRAIEDNQYIVFLRTRDACTNFFWWFPGQPCNPRISIDIWLRHK